MEFEALRARRSGARHQIKRRRYRRVCVRRGQPNLQSSEACASNTEAATVATREGLALAEARGVGVPRVPGGVPVGDAVCSCCRCRGCRSGSRCHCGRGCSWRRSWSSPCLAEKFHRGHRNGGTVVAARQPNPRCAVRVGGEVAPCSRERRDGRTRCPSVSAGVVNVLSPDSACTKNPIAKIAASQKIDRAALDILMLLVPFSAPACEFHCVESQLTLCGSVVMVEVQVWDAA
jgi:hypothetical protein